ncbi:hypothetical protein SAMN04489798_3397 [Pseudomonas arsenicoxydans]|uniref:Uncharacterized protein n=1 Tax=Pseudomonas arsenicoxydans TaxID=702115 RepID=A0A1H0KYS4_9PSED|nr:hypothetical protein [Pseudomonas arsenicoxydans]SDO60921.1 hypothetical protein SAMN04489798_3397 [Pseudomonas arsenicoxydans]
MADLIKGLDGPRTAQQELFYGLEDSAAILGWSVIELTDTASKSNESQSAFFMKICKMLKAEQDKLRGYAAEVKAGTIVRAKPE